MYISQYICINTLYPRKNCAKIYQAAFAARYICIWIQRMKFVRWNGSSAGYSMPAALPASMQ